MIQPLSNPRWNPPTGHEAVLLASLKPQQLNTQKQTSFCILTFFPPQPTHIRVLGEGRWDGGGAHSRHFVRRNPPREGDESGTIMAGRHSYGRSQGSLPAPLPLHLLRQQASWSGGALGGSRFGVVEPGV